MDFDDEKSLNDVINNATMSDDEVIASYGSSRSLFSSRSELFRFRLPWDRYLAIFSAQIIQSVFALLALSTEEAYLVKLLMPTLAHRSDSSGTAWLCH